MSISCDECGRDAEKSCEACGLHFCGDCNKHATEGLCGDCGWRHVHHADPDNPCPICAESEARRELIAASSLAALARIQELNERDGITEPTPEQEVEEVRELRSESKSGEADQLPFVAKIRMADGTEYAAVHVAMHGTAFHLDSDSRAFTFSAALRALKAGERVRRLGWNGKGMWVVLFTFSIDFGTLGREKITDAARMVAPCLALCRNEGREIQPGWVPSQADMLTDDWIIVT